MVEPEVAYAELDDMMELAEGALVSVVARVLDKRAAGAEGARARHDEARSGEGAVPAHHLRRGRADAARTKGLPFESAATSAAPTRPCCPEQFDRPVLRPPLPGRDQGVLHEARPERPDIALCVDVLAPEGYGEIIGGGQRVDDYDLLLQRIEEHKLPQEAFEWYLDLRRYGSVPHAGFGMGIERCVAWICGLEHVRETIPFPRMLYRLYP